MRSEKKWAHSETLKKIIFCIIYLSRFTKLPIKVSIENLHKCTKHFFDTYGYEYVYLTLHCSLVKSEERDNSHLCSAFINIFQNENMKHMLLLVECALLCCFIIF